MAAAGLAAFQTSLQNDRCRRRHILYRQHLIECRRRGAATLRQRGLDAVRHLQRFCQSCLALFDQRVPLHCGLQTLSATSEVHIRIRRQRQPQPFDDRIARHGLGRSTAAGIAACRITRPVPEHLALGQRVAARPVRTPHATGKLADDMHACNR